ncbi:MAG: hypothetical protein IJA98_03860 [Bacteroidaceae bacterium]|nr:hypothetical protein [Bacteroidaceae bacterium]MBQ3238190.1 hypothetical protein [Bacteroidaceae bacterium]
MKKLFYLISMVCLLASCNKDPEPEPIVVTNDALTGTWVYDNAATGVTEILKFTPNGGFYYTTVLADAAFVGYKPEGSFSVIDKVNLTAVGLTKSLDWMVTKLKTNSFTVKDNVTGETRTYAKLVDRLDLGFGEIYTPNEGYYAEKVAGKITKYVSHNEKVARVVDHTGVIAAVAEGITLVDVVASEGTAVILVTAGGLIPDYARAIGYTKEEVLAEYGSVEDNSGFMIVYNGEDKNLEFSINRRTGLVVKVTLAFKHLAFTKTSLTNYLGAKYYKDASAKTPPYIYTDKQDFSRSNVKIVWDNESKVEFTYINHDLFEDFSVALGKNRQEVKEMFYIDCERYEDLNSFIEFEIADDMLGYAGLEYVDQVSLMFDGETVNVVDVSLTSLLDQKKVNEFLSKKYKQSSENTYTDELGKISIEYISSGNKVRYLSL